MLGFHVTRVEMRWDHRRQGRTSRSLDATANGQNEAAFAAEAHQHAPRPHPTRHTCSSTPPAAPLGRPAKPPPIRHSMRPRSPVPFQIPGNSPPVGAAPHNGAAPPGPPLNTNYTSRSISPESRQLHIGRISAVLHPAQYRQKRITPRQNLAQVAENRRPRRRAELELRGGCRRSTSRTRLQGRHSTVESKLYRSAVRSRIHFRMSTGISPWDPLAGRARSRPRNTGFSRKKGVVRSLRTRTQPQQKNARGLEHGQPAARRSPSEIGETKPARGNG